MQVVELKREELSCSYQVTVPSTTISIHVDQELLRIGKTYRMQGFRPGKVPLSVLRAKLGTAVMADALQRAVNDTTQKVMQDKNLRPASQPKIKVDQFDEGRDLVFTMDVETLPKINVMDLSALSIEKPVAEVDEDSVNKALESIASQHESSKEVKRAAKEGDYVIIDFQGKTKAGETFPGMSLDDFELKLGAGRMIPGFEDPIIGAKAGDKMDVNVTFPADYGMPGLAGKDAVFAVTVKEVKETIPAQLDDALAKKTGFADLAALKKAIAERTKQEYETFSRLKVKRALLDKMDAGHQFTLPAGMVDAEYQAIVKQMESERHAHAHANDPDHSHDHDHANHSHLTDEEREELKDIAARRVRLGLVLAEIGTLNNIQVSDQDLNRALMMEAQKYPGQEKQVIEFYRKNRNAIESLRAPIFEEKIVTFILEKAKVSEKTVTVEELTRDDDAEGDAKPAKKTAAKKPAKKADDSAAAESAPKKPAAKKTAKKAAE